MGKEKLTQSEQMSGFAIRDLPSDDSQPFSSYYNPKTGVQIERLPADAYSIKQYRGRGFILGALPRDYVKIEQEESINDESSLVKLMLEMREEIQKLKTQLNGEIIEIEEAPKEPVQLKMF